MKNSTALAVLSLFLTANIAVAQFTPDGTINGTVNNPQTLAGGTGTVTSTGNLSVAGAGNANVAVTVTGSSTIDNQGKIEQTGSARAIRLNTNTVTLTVNNGSAGNGTAKILATADDAFQVAQANDSVTLNNYGTINTPGGQAINWRSITTGSNAINNFATGNITATGADAVRPGVNGIVSNLGIIRATPVVPLGGSAPGSDGIDTGTDTGVQVTNSGTIEGRTGVTGGFDSATGLPLSYAISVTNQTGGIISGVNGSGINIDGVFTNFTATVINQNGATMKGTWDGVSASGDGDGIDVDGVVNLTNNGFIRGLGANGNGSDGFPNGPDGVAAGGGTIVNGTGAEITASVTTGNATSSFGILIDNSSKSDAIAATNLTNRGLIKSDNGPAVVFISTFANTVTNEASGTINGAGLGAQGAAIQPGNGNDIVNNSGAIVGNNGFAIDMQGGNNTLNITGGAASITGNVSGGTGGTNALVIDPGSGNSFSYTGQLSNFNSAEIKSGTVTLSGANTYSGNTTISGGTLVAQNVAGTATGTGTVAVNNGAKLGGTGTVGAVTVSSGGTVAPGQIAGILNSGNVTFNGGSIFSIEIGGAVAGAHDQLNVTGTVNLGGSTLSGTLINGFTPTAGQQFVIIQSSGAITGTFAQGSSVNIGGKSFTISYNANSVVLSISAAPTPTATATATATPAATPTATATATPGASATPTATATPIAGLVGNVSTRLPVGTGDNILIEGFIVQGPAGSTKNIIVRAIGPSLIPFGITDALANPTLEIHDSNDTIVATNDNWKTTQVGGIITGDQSQQINASGVAPGDDKESAIIANLAPGSYTALVRGAGNSVGTGVVDAYDLSGATAARLANIATRGLIQPGDKLMIAGFIIQNGPVRLVVRAIGPSLSAFGITNALPDTTLQLKDQNGATVIENDDWQSAQKAELESTGLQPTHPLEAAVVATILPGQYTAQVRGKPEATGIGVVQVYFLQ
jgi:hypothetical protein